MRWTASRSCAPQSQRSLPKTSPVRHSLCGRTSATEPSSQERIGPALSPSPKARWSWSSTRPSKLKTRAFALYPSVKRRGSVTCVRIVAIGRCRVIDLSVGPELRRERVAQQHHVADLADLGERRAPVRVPREVPVAHEAWRARVADEEWSDHELQLV